MAPAGRVSRHFEKERVDNMAKAKRLGANSPRPIQQARRFGRSDIPYKDRLLMDKMRSIADHRDDAARTAMKVATVVLNDMGLGYERLCRFAKAYQQLIRLYYEDPDYQEEKLNQRLRQIGFLVEDGRVFGAVDENGNTVPTKELMGHD